MGSPYDVEPIACECGEEKDLRVFNGEVRCWGCFSIGLRCSARLVDVWANLPTPAEHARDQATERGDYLYHKMKDG